MRDSVPSARFPTFVMYCVYGESGSSLLIDSMIWNTMKRHHGTVFGDELSV